MSENPPSDVGTVTGSPPAITLDRLVVSRGGVPLTQPISLRFEAGSLWQITGANGSGKTSLIRVLAGLLDPLAGQVLQDWTLPDPSPVRLFDPQWQRQIAWHPVQPVLKPGPSVRETLMVQTGLRADQATADLTRWGLARFADQPVQYLSAGQRKRLDLARLSHNPRPIWLLDEPTVTLDQEARALLGQVLSRHRDQGGLAIVASHDALPLDAALQTLRLGEQAVMGTVS